MPLARLRRPRLLWRRFNGLASRYAIRKVDVSPIRITSKGADQARAVLRMSSRSRLSHRTYAGLPNWSLGRHRRPLLVLRKRCGCQGRCFKSPAAKSSGRSRRLQDIEAVASIFPSPTSATKSTQSGPMKYFGPRFHIMRIASFQLRVFVQRKVKPPSTTRLWPVM